jgi:hypothetical protein
MGLAERAGCRAHRKRHPPLSSDAPHIAELVWKAAASADAEQAATLDDAQASRVGRRSLPQIAVAVA